MAEEQDCPPCKKGAPDWMVTFSDLMTLLLTFFVILLSISTVSDPKFQEAAESLNEAFSGVYVLGQPTKNIITIDDFEPVNQKIEVKEQDRSDDLTATKEQEYTEQEKFKFQIVQALEEMIQELINIEVDKGVAEVENKQDKILIRFPAEATFESGSSDLKPAMEKVIIALADSLRNLDLTFVVNGHTDDVPINSLKYRSNWDLSGARASSVAYIFELYGSFPSSNIEVVGHSDGNPIVPNDSKENRERNRRIEVYIEPGTDNIEPVLFDEILEVTGYDTTAYQVKPNKVKDSTKKKNDTSKVKEKEKVEEKSKIDQIKDKIRLFKNK